MICPVCGSDDVKDLGYVAVLNRFTTNVHVCKGCGRYLERVVTVREITDKEVLAAIDV